MNVSRHNHTDGKWHTDTHAAGRSHTNGQVVSSGSSLTDAGRHNPTNGNRYTDCHTTGNDYVNGQALLSDNGFVDGRAHPNETAPVNGNGSVQLNGNGKAHIDGHTHKNSNGHPYENEHQKDIELVQDATQIGDRPHLLLFSANGDASLKGNIETYHEYLPTCEASLKDVAYTLALRRDPKSHRAFAVASDKLSWETSPPETAKPTSVVAWIFTGQGAQWPEMGAELIDSNSIFQRTIRSLDRFLLGLPNPPPWIIEDELRKVAGVSRVQKAEMGHPLSIAVQVGLVNVLRSWNITPDFVLGHSSGEMAAAYASGAITAEAAMAAATFRGTTSGDTSEKRGSMAAIGLGAQEMAPFMEPGAVIACENSQCSVTVSGDSEQVEKVVQNVKEQRPGVLARFLRVEKAFHSRECIARRGIR